MSENFEDDIMSEDVEDSEADGPRTGLFWRLYDIFTSTFNGVKEEAKRGGQHIREMIGNIENAVSDRTEQLDPLIVPPAVPQDADDQAKYELQNSKRQWEALALGLLAWISCSLASGWLSDACVTFSHEHAGKTVSCKVKDEVGLPVYRDVELKNFCWSSCSSTHPLGRPLNCIMAGIFLQAFVVISNACFPTLLQVTVNLDLSDKLTLGAKRRLSSFLQPLQKIKEYLFDQLRMQSDFSLLPTYLVSKLSLGINAFALLDLMLKLAFSWKYFGIFFECEGSQSIHTNPQPSLQKIVALVLASVCLFTKILCQSSIAWEVKCSLSLHDETAGVVDPRRDVFEELGSGLYAVKHDCGHHLLSMYISWELESPREPQNIKAFTEIRLRPPAAQSSSPGDKHRYAAMFFIVLGIMLLHQASESCWVCIQGLQVAPGMLLSLPELTTRIEFLGVCGRPDFSGTFASLAVWLLLLSLLLRACAVLAGVYTERRLVKGSMQPKTYEEMCHETERRNWQTTWADMDTYHAIEGEVAMPVLDMRARNTMTLARYVRDGLKIPCYVWVRPVDNNKWVYPNGTDDPPNGTGDSARKNWHRSSNYLRTVKLIQMPDDAEKWKTGLKEVYGPLLHYIEFEDDDGQRKKQIIPSSFIPGLLYCEVQCGHPRHWRRLTLLGNCLAFLCVLVELVLFAIRGGVLQFCREIFNGHCNMDYQIDVGVFTFEISKGLYLTISGGASALLGSLLWRNANTKRTTS